MLKIEVNNGKATIRGENNLIGICADLCTIIDLIHTEFVTKDPTLGKAFWYTLTAALDDKGTPLWSGNTAAMAGGANRIWSGQRKEPPQCWHTRTAVETLHHDSSTGQKEKQLLSKEEIQ